MCFFIVFPKISDNKNDQKFLQMSLQIAYLITPFTF